jgi:hypothetical protein
MRQQQVARSVSLSPPQMERMGQRQTRHLRSHRPSQQSPRLKQLPIRKSRQTNHRIKLRQQSRQSHLPSASSLLPPNSLHFPLILQHNHKSHLHRAPVTAHHNQHLQQGLAWTNLYQGTKRHLSQQRASLAHSPLLRQRLNSRSHLLAHRPSQHQLRAAMFLNPRRPWQPLNHPKSQALLQHRSHRPHHPVISSVTSLSGS